MSGVHEWLSVEFARERNARALEEAEARRLAQLATSATERSSLRARAARRLFGFAVAAGRDETWRAVWERLEAPRHL
jgi:hypothetical protein